jgi:hypothetical protein
MFNLFLLTLLTCNQVFGLYQRLITNPTLTETQKKEIMKEIQKVVKSCPVIIKNERLLYTNIRRALFKARL